jgi:UDP-2,3-diacylglucosamine hydrolase
LLGQDFAQVTGGTLLDEQAVIHCGDRSILVMHGDQLCTLDEKYMAFRQQSRDPAWQQMMLEKPLDQRLMIANLWRMQSKANNANKPENIMDVTPDEVLRVLTQYQVTTLLHGHTHRPAVHNITLNNQPAQRLVLGDWRESEGCAVIGVCDNQGLRLENWAF